MLNRLLRAMIHNDYDYDYDYDNDNDYNNYIYKPVIFLIEMKTNLKQQKCFIIAKNFIYFLLRWLLN